MGESAVMYIGPTVRGVVRHGDTFSGGIPGRLETLAESRPIVRDLIVPLSGAVEAEKDARTEGMALAIAYGRILSMPDEEVREIMEGEKNDVKL